jgi:hypothetical protein
VVIGKPATKGDASNGYMNTTLLAQCVDTAYQQGWGAYNIPRAIQQGLTTVSRCWRYGVGGELS